MSGNMLNPDMLKTDAEKAYRQLRSDIVRCELNAGLKLRMVFLKERYSIGAGPLREALSRLSSEKLVVQEERKGFEVAPMTFDDAVDTARVRILLEQEALRESIQNGNDDWEVMLVAAYHHLSLAEKSSLPPTEKSIEVEIRNERFHETLVSASTSRWLLELRRNIYYHHERYRYLSRDLSSGKRNTAKEHKLIFEAALARDIDKTCDLNKQHILRTNEMVQKVLISK